MTLSIVFSYLVFMNLVGFAAFGIDKYKAVHHRWRIREAVLFTIAFLGGSIGCLAGMYLFHHKTLHRSFVLGIPFILAVELIAGCTIFYYYTDHTPYRQDPVKLVQHELTSLSGQDSDSVSKFLNVHDVFPASGNNQVISSDITSVFAGFFRNFSYQILNSQQKDHTASVTVSLTTPDGKQLAKEYSRQVMIKQIQNSASPASVDFSLEDCYLLLGNVLKTSEQKNVTSTYTIQLTRSGKNWCIDSPKSLSAAVTGNFASYVADASLFSPSEVIAIHLDTLKNFDVEQLTRYLALDALFSDTSTENRSLTKSIASQLHTCLNYTVTSESMDQANGSACVTADLTSCDFSSIASDFQEQYAAYLNSSQALEDGTSGRQTHASQLLCDCITNNTATVTTAVTIHLTNDGNNWRFSQTDEMTAALLGNIEEILSTLRSQTNA